MTVVERVSSRVDLVVAKDPLVVVVGGGAYDGCEGDAEVVGVSGAGVGVSTVAGVVFL
jgi:hypothetical protein